MGRKELIDVAWEIVTSHGGTWTGREVLLTNEEIVDIIRQFIPNWNK